MSSNESDPATALRRAEVARDAVTQAIEGTFERLATLRQSARADIAADLQAAGRLLARNTHRQLAANLTLVQGLMEARSLPALRKLQQDYLDRQMEWILRDWERMRAQARALLQEGGPGAAAPSGPTGPEPPPDGPDTEPPDADAQRPGPP